MRFENFQDGTLGAISDIGQEQFSAILNLYVASMPPIKFELNPHYGLGGDVIWRISRWPSQMAERKEFSSSESPCLPKASHQVSAQSESYRFVWFAAFNNLSVISWWCLDVAGSSMLTFRVLPHWNITSQTLWHDIPPSPILQTLSWPVLHVKVSGAYSTHSHFTGIELTSSSSTFYRCCFKIFKMATMMAILDIGMEI